MLTIFLVIILFSALVIGHELGHYFLAKRNGVKVEEFGLGFPPRITGRKFGDTFYSLNLLPLGGFVRLAGEDGDLTAPHTFGAASLWAKTKILMAGVVANLIIAFVILLALALTGLPGLGGLEPKFLNPSFAQPKQLLIASVEPGSPAAKLGLERGDFILRANGQPVGGDGQLRSFTQENAGQAVTLEIKQDDKVTTREVNLRQSNEGGALGVATQEVYKLRYEPLEAIVAAAWITGALFVATVVGVVTLLLSLPSLIAGIFGSGVPQAAQAAAGPVGIIFILQSIGNFGWSYLFLFIANISVALAGFNALPLPALDGGRLAVAYVRRLTGGRITPEAEAYYHGIGFIALLALVALISVYDVRKFF